MTKNKTLSNLSMAVVALLAATVSCFAQAQSTENFSETAGSAVATNSSLALAFNGNPFGAAASRFDGRSVESRSVEPKAIFNVAPAKSPLNLSAATFEVSNQFATENKAFLGSQVSAIDAGKFDSKQQFRANDYAPVKTPKVSFVPSRGPWMPN